MEVIVGRCAGLDVHKDSVEACVRRMSAGGKVEHEIRHWGTTTRELVAMAEWLGSTGITHVAIAYASYCTSLGRCETFSNRSLFDNFTPLAFLGGSGPGSS